MLLSQNFEIIFGWYFLLLDCESIILDCIALLHEVISFTLYCITSPKSLDIVCSIGIYICHFQIVVQFHEKFRENDFTEKGGGEGGVYWIELMGSLFEGRRRREGPIVCIILLASSLSWFIIVGKTSKLFLLGFFLPIYTGFLYVCMYGWARALRGEAKSSSNKRSTCSVTTWSSVISAGSVLFFIFKSLCFHSTVD